MIKAPIPCQAQSRSAGCGTQREWRGIFTLPLCNGLAAAALEEWQTQIVLYVKPDSPPHLGHVSTRDGATTAQTEGLPDPQTAEKDLGCTAASDSQFLKWELQMRQGMSKVGRERKNRQRKNKGRTWRNRVKSHWGSASKAGKQLHCSPPGITNLESTPETMQWSNAYKNVCTWKKPLEESIPTGRYHGIFYTLHRLPQTFQEYYFIFSFRNSRYTLSTSGSTWLHLPLSICL